MENKAKYAFDDWVGAVRSDPRNTDQLIVLQGYLGASSETGHLRIYTDESLNNFMEVPEDGIVYAMKMTATESSLGGSKVWLRADTVITYGDPKLANRPRSTFLEGDIMQQYNTFGQPDTTQMAGMSGTGQADGTEQNVQAQATSLQVLCNTQFVTRAVKQSICLICPTRIQFSCFRTVCNLLTCRRSLCGPQSCIPVLCGGGGCLAGTQFPGPNSIACGPGGFPGGPIGNPGLGAVGVQADTTQMGGYYNTFNPYMY
ncbi:hypothetical protein [Spirosoma rigui]|uniref:hypothetical protein n=1 Tax=Spirosoma rigui TaxID=564064 RepID=UPI0009B05CD1|nr:hypothetical protein [Spirosoma rigui]